MGIRQTVSKEYRSQISDDLLIMLSWGGLVFTVFILSAMLSHDFSLLSKHRDFILDWPSFLRAYPKQRVIWYATGFYMMRFLFCRIGRPHYLFRLPPGVTLPEELRK